MDDVNFKRTWPQLMCCALVTPGVLISEGEIRRSLEKRGMTRWRSKVDFQTRVTEIQDLAIYTELECKT